MKKWLLFSVLILSLSTTNSFGFIKLINLSAGFVDGKYQNPSKQKNLSPVKGFLVASTVNAFNGLASGLFATFQEDSLGVGIGAGIAGSVLPFFNYFQGVVLGMAYSKFKKNWQQSSLSN